MTGRALRSLPGVWSLCSSQPGGLPDGSRWSPRVVRGGDHREASRKRSRTPAGVPDSWLPRAHESGVAPKRRACCENSGPIDPECGAVLSSVGWFWHPSPGCWPIRRFPGGRSPFALDDLRLPSANPAGWTPLLSSAKNVQTPGGALRFRCGCRKVAETRGFGRPRAARRGLRALPLRAQARWATRSYGGVDCLRLS